MSRQQSRDAALLREIDRCDANFAGVRRPLDVALIDEVRRSFGDQVRTVYLCGSRDPDDGSVSVGGIAARDGRGQFIAPQRLALMDINGDELDVGDDEIDLSSDESYAEAIREGGKALIIQLGVELAREVLDDVLLEEVRDNCHPDAGEDDWARFVMSGPGEMPARNTSEADPYTHLEAAWTQAPEHLRAAIFALADNQTLGELLRERAEQQQRTLGMIELALRDNGEDADPEAVLPWMLMALGTHAPGGSQVIADQHNP